MNWTERLATIWNLGSVKLQTPNGKLQFAVSLEKKVSNHSIIAHVKREAAVCLLEKSRGNRFSWLCDYHYLWNKYKLYHGFGGLKYRLKAEASH